MLLAVVADRALLINENCHFIHNPRETYKRRSSVCLRPGTLLDISLLNILVSRFPRHYGQGVKGGRKESYLDANLRLRCRFREGLQDVGVMRCENKLRLDSGDMAALYTIFYLYRALLENNSASSHCASSPA